MADLMAGLMAGTKGVSSDSRVVLGSCPCRPLLEAPAGTLRWHVLVRTEAIEPFPKNMNTYGLATRGFRCRNQPPLM